MKIGPVDELCAINIVDNPVVHNSDGRCKKFLSTILFYLHRQKCRCRRALRRCNMLKVDEANQFCDEWWSQSGVSALVSRARSGTIDSG